jgi:hypothetical protein
MKTRQNESKRMNVDHWSAETLEARKKYFELLTLKSTALRSFEKWKLTSRQGITSQKTLIFIRHQCQGKTHEGGTAPLVISGA